MIFGVNGLGVDKCCGVDIIVVVIGVGGGEIGKIGDEEELWVGSSWIVVIIIKFNVLG